MKRLSQIVTSSIACSAAFAQAAFAGNAIDPGAYSSGTTINDSGSDAGVYLLLAVGALLLIRAATAPKPAEPPAETPDATE